MKRSYTDEAVCSLLLVSDPRILIQRGAECNQLVCKCLQSFSFVLTVAAVNALESRWIIKRKHLQCTHEHRVL